MGKYLYYIIALVSALIMFGIYFLLHRKNSKKVPLVHKILAWVLFALMFVWLLLGKGGPIRNVVRLENFSPFLGEETLLGVKATTALVLIAIWGHIILHIITQVAPFFEFKIIHRMERLVSPVLAVFVLILLPKMLYGITLTYNLTAMGILFSIELGLIIGKLVYLWVFDRIPLKMSKVEIVEFVLCILGAILFTMPDYTLIAFFGYPKFYAYTLNFSEGHR